MSENVSLSNASSTSSTSVGLGEKKSKDYKSPVSKLSAFFKRSRDKWKVKCLELRKKEKYFINKVKFLELSRSKWKEAYDKTSSSLKSKELEIKKMHQELEDKNSELAEKKNTPPLQSGLKG
jgi:hypothetical protein